MRTVTFDVASSTVGNLSIDLTNGAGTASTLSISASNTLNATSILVGGYNGTAVPATAGRGVVIQSAGAVNVSSVSDLVLGYGAGSLGTYTFSGGTLVAGQSEFIGLNGTGTFTQSGGSNTINAGVIGGFDIGAFAGSTGTYNLDGGTLVSLKSEYIGDSGVGNFNQTAGSNLIGGGSDLYIGFSTGGRGVYTLGSGSLTAGDGNEYIGYNATGDVLHFGGKFIQSGDSTNTLLSSRTLYLGRNPNSTGNYIISDTAHLTTGNVVVGLSGSGTMTIQDQANVYIANSITINGSSILNMNGGTLRFDTISGVNRLAYNAGTIQLTGQRFIGIDSTIATLYGASPTIPTGKGLTLETFGTHNINGTLKVNGGSFTWAGDLIVGGSALGALQITNSGTAFGGSVYLGYNSFGSSALVGTGATWTLSNLLSVGTFNPASLEIQTGGTVWTNILDIESAGVLNLRGGTLRIGTYTGGGTINFESGTVHLSGNRTIGSDAAILDFFGGAPTLVAGKGLTIDGAATLLGIVTVNGGTLSVGQIANGQNLHLLHGTLNYSENLTIGSGGPLGSTLDLAADMNFNGTLGITNNGLVTGDGLITVGAVPFQNGAAGEIRAEPGKSLTISGPNTSNSGHINLFGGMLDITQNLTNNAGAFISGNGTLKTTTGLTNNGTMNFSGLANVVGDVTNSATGKIISSGGGPTTFLDDVVNSGEIRTSNGSFTVFFGSVSGSGTFTGTGIVNFEGDLSPGSSPAAVSFGGSVALGAAALVRIELGGTTPGTQYDRVNVSGQLALGGTLDVDLLNGFTPALGNQFTVLTFASRSGDFANYTGLNVGGHLTLRHAFTANGLLLTARPAIDGDINTDGTVNIFDVNDVSAHWSQNGPAGDANGDGIVDIFDINLISSNWGATGGVTGVPEPSTFVLALVGLLGAGVGCGRRARR